MGGLRFPNDTMNNLCESIQKLAAAPESAHDPRGRVRAALSLLPEDSQKTLACDFAAHGIIQFEPGGDEKVEAALKTLDGIRGFLAGTESIQEVNRLGQLANHLDTIEIQRDQGQAFICGSIAHILRLTELFCCQRELEAANLMFRNKYQPNASDIVSEICAAVARVVGGSDWDADDVYRREIAHQRGRRASDQEAEWQFSQILSQVCSP